MSIFGSIHLQHWYPNYENPEYMGQVLLAPPPPPQEGQTPCPPPVGWGGFLPPPVGWGGLVWGRGGSQIDVSVS